MTTAVAQRSITALFDPKVWGVLKEQATVLFGSKFFPNTIKSPEAAIAVVMKGYELSIPPMQACSHIFLVNGRVTCSAELQLALIYRDCRGAQIDFIKLDNEGCIIEAARPGHKAIKIGFSMDDAKKAGLTGKDNWKNYPRSMCRSRAVSEMARTLFADAINGMSYTPEELDPEIPYNPSDEATITLEPVQSVPSLPQSDNIFHPLTKRALHILEKLGERFPGRTFEDNYKKRLSNEILSGREIKPGFLEEGVRELDEKISQELRAQIELEEIQPDIEISL